MTTNTPPSDKMPTEQTARPVLPDMVYQNVLIGLEMDTPDVSVLRYLARWQGWARLFNLHFVHVLTEQPTPFPKEKLEKWLSLEDTSARRRILLDALQKAVENEGISTTKSRVHFAVEKGNPVDQLVARAADMPADLIVLGRRSETDERLLYAKNLIREVGGDVLVIPQRTSAELRRILVPIDFSAYAVRALRAALIIQAASPEPVMIQAVNFYQRPDLMALDLSMTPDQFTENIVGLHQEGYQTFMQQHFPALHQRIEPLLVQDDSPAVASAILAQAKTSRSDLIIMGVKGHSQLALLLLGSTTERVLDLNDRLPLLLIK